MRRHVLLFEWMVGGHFELYVRRFAEALGPRASVTIAAPDIVCERLSSLSADFRPLGPPRPSIDDLGRGRIQTITERELDLFESTVAGTRPDHVIHLYSDRILRRLVARAPLRAAVTVCIFRPRVHYPLTYRTLLPPVEMAKAVLLEALVARWRRRSDAHSILTLDEAAAARWARRKGAPAHWLPEPPVADPPPRPAEAAWDCCLYGALAERKGVRLLARAIADRPTSARVVLAGAVDNGFEDRLRAYTAEMTLAGAQVDMRDWPHEEAAGLEVLAGSRCAAVPYTGHYGMSRVLVEAATVGTPLVVDRRGLIGELASRHDLGRVVDCRDPRALRAAIESLSSEEPDAALRAGLWDPLESTCRHASLSIL